MNSGEPYWGAWVLRAPSPEYADRHGWRSDNLNEMLIETDGEPEALNDHGITMGAVTVHFRDLVTRLCDFIATADVVVGCVAWITHPSVLNALTHCEGVSLIVNKEDFLRPDGGYVNDARLRYNGLSGINRYEHEPAFGLNVASDPTTAPVRCVGVCDGRKPSFRPRLHHKFLVSLRVTERPVTDPETGWEIGNTKHQAVAVWTGSFNPTRGGERSLENAVVLSDPVIATSYYAEWGQALALSEPLDWSSEWVEPEYRIGT